MTITTIRCYTAIDHTVAESVDVGEVAGNVM